MSTAVCHLNELQADVINRGSDDYSSAAKGWSLTSLVVATHRARPSRIASAIKDVAELKAGPVKTQALTLLADLDLALSRYDVGELPEFSAREHDDGSATVEMRFPDRRLAFTLESDPRESGWHVVSTRSSGGLQACGDLPVSGSDLLVILALATRRFPNK